MIAHLLSLALVGTTLVAPQDPASQLVRANTAYAEGKYTEATKLYQRLADSGVDNGHLHYNLGNCHLRTGELGSAIAAYLRAQSLLPRDPDIDANLAFARKTTKDAIAPRQSAAVLRTLFFWHFALSRLELLQAAVVLNLIFWLLLLARMTRPSSELLRWGAMASLAVLLAVGISLAVRVTMPRRVAVVQKVEINVHSGTSRDTVVRFKLHAGTETEWVGTQGEWLRVQLPDEKQGWVHGGDVAALVL